VDFDLHPVEARVLSSLIEKEITTPEYYPLSLNALVNACNQKSNRDPAVSYDESTVLQAIDLLRNKGLVTTITGAGSRVPKYAHRFSEKLNLGRREIAILCELMLRGPQTVGELKNRAERLHRFNDLAEVESLLDRMTEFVVKLARRTGEKESRYGHLFSGPVDNSEPEATAPTGRADRIGTLEAEVGQLRSEMDDLKRQFADFRRQFE
jgi:uncharacterized protein YceH (UPF0502 family)